jgi:hypothetical protein
MSNFPHPWEKAAWDTPKPQEVIETPYRDGYRDGVAAERKLRLSVCKEAEMTARRLYAHWDITGEFAPDTGIALRKLSTQLQQAIREA